MHGDYLFDDIKSTLRETESLEANIKEKFFEFCKEYGLIVLGYSGGDRSIVDVLEFLTKQENYLKNGVYWCLRPGDYVCHALRNLLWREKVYPVLIEGFDEFFAETHNKLVGQTLALSANMKQSKLQNAIKKITDDDFNISRNQVIRNEIDRILENNNSQDVSEFISSLSKDSDAKLGVLDLRNLLEVRSLVESQDLAQAYKVCEEHFHECVTDDAKPLYIESLIGISEKIRDDAKASRWCEKLIEIDSNNPQYHIRKAGYIRNTEERFEALVELTSSFEFSAVLRNRIGSVARKVARTNKKLLPKLNEGIEHLERSLQIDPGLDNPAWVGLYNCLSLLEKQSPECDKNSDLLVKRARLQNPESMRTLELSQLAAERSKDSKEIKGLLDLLYGIHKKSSLQKRHELNLIIARTLAGIYELDDPSSLSHEFPKFFDVHLADTKIDDPEILLEKARYLLELSKDASMTIDTLDQAITKASNAKALTSIIALAKLTGPTLIPKVEVSLEKQRHKFYPEYYYEALSELCAWKGDVDGAKDSLEKAFREGLPIDTYLSSLSFLLLKSESYKSVVKLYESQSKTLEL